MSGTIPKRKGTTRRSPGTVTVSAVRSRNLPGRGKEEEVLADAEEPIGEGLETGPEFARVSFSAAITRNLGNYESFRAQVSMELPCRPDQVYRALTSAKLGVYAIGNGVLTDVLGPAEDDPGPRFPSPGPEDEASSPDDWDDDE